MEVLLSEDWKPMVDDLVQAGRYGSANEVVDEGMRLVQEREAKIAALRAKIEAALASHERYTDEEVGQYLEAEMDRWENAHMAQ